MKVIIAGSRTIDFTILEMVEWVRMSRFDVSEIVSGTARGADMLGETWAHVHAVPVKRFPAEWSRFGYDAGLLRNAAMADYADALILIWDGESRGSANMLKCMQLYHKPVFEVQVHMLPAFVDQQRIERRRRIGIHSD